MSSTLTSSPRPTFADPETVTAGEIETGDWLVEVLPARGIGYVLIERLVTDAAEGPSHSGITDGDPARLGRVRLTLTDGRRPLLPVGQPVVIRRRTA